jgi:hypothetical protein
MAEWEAEHGYRSTYYILHTSPYWGRPGFRESLERIAISATRSASTRRARRSSPTGGDPHLILDEPSNLRCATGSLDHGVAGHGNPFCNRDLSE